MPHLARISIFPVKSLDAVGVSTARVLGSGALADDRRFAIVDSSGQFVNGKRNPRVHLLRSTFDPLNQTLQLTAPKGVPSRAFHVESDKRALEQWLGEFFGFPVSFRENGGVGFPDDLESPGPTLVSTATLRAVADWFGLTLDQTRARFRTNLEIDGVPPFWEDRLYGQRGTMVRFRLGSVVFDGINPCQRCVVPSRDQQTGADTKDFAKRFVELRRKFLPDWAETTRFDHFYRLAINTRLVDQKPGQRLQVGDLVELIGPVVSQPMPAASLPGVPSRWSGDLKLIEVSRNTPSVCTFRFGAVDGGVLPFSYLPGQFLSIELPVNGTLQRRCFTIASSPTQREWCELTIKREPGGVVSRYLHEQAKPGMLLRVSGPGGKFTFTGEEASGIVLIGAGVGITPLMSVIRYLADRKWAGPIDLVYSAQKEGEIIFREELCSLRRTLPKLRTTITLTQETGADWKGERGRISGELLQRSVGNFGGKRIHLCGPVAMTDHLRELLMECGADAAQIHAESFGGAPAKTKPIGGDGGGHGGAIGSVTFAESGKSIPVNNGDTVLELASAAGVLIDRGCLAGVCGRCRVRLLSGDVQCGVDDGLTDTDRAGGYILSCQSRPRGNVAVEI